MIGNCLRRFPGDFAERHRPTMATVYMLCGLPGSGKTTRARQIEQEHQAIRLAEDDWIARLYDESAILDNVRRDLVKSVQLSLAERLLALGIDVIFDWGVWSRSDRADYRARIAALGASFVLVYLDVPLAELHRRIARRNQNLPPHTFHITPAELDEWWALSEPPPPDEHPVP